MKNTSARGTIYFSLADPIGFSGQKAAVELIIRGLSGRGWKCRRLPLPAFRDSGRLTNPVRFLADLVVAWVRDLRLIGARGSWMFVSLGQTRFSFVRDLVPVLLARVGLGRERICIVLQGSLFMRWAKDSLDTRLFTFLLSNAGRVSVPGEGQKARLIDLGIADDRVVVVVNSCESEVLKPESVHAKHNPGPSPGRPVHVLYLSSLIDTKGYPEFLEAIRRAASWGGPRIEAVLCGQISPSEFSERFNDPAVAEAWIEGEVAAINRGARSKIRWIRGATGSEKAALLREADIFVLPTRYAVESQPVALLEAMASGCAIVTTPAGEIPTILDKECAILLPAASVEAVEEALQLLTTSPNRRASLAAAANRRFVERYSLDRHIDAWEKLLDGMAGGRRERRAVAAT